MRRIAILFSVYILFISSLVAQYPDTIIVRTKKVKGFGPFQMRLGFVQEMASNNSWTATVPEYKGIPSDLEHLMFAVEQTDFMQHTYQNYISGKISEERFKELKQAWNWNPKESEYSKEFIKVDLGIIAGYDSEGTLKIKIDKNNNYDFSDEQYFDLPPKQPGQNFWGRYNDQILHEVSYEFFDGEKKVTNAWVYLDYSPPQYNSSKKLVDPIQLSFAFAQHHIGEFEVDGEKYSIAIKSDRAVFRDYFSVKVWTENTMTSQSSIDEGIQKNGHTKIGNFYYRINDATIDGSTITLIKDKSVEERGGNEVGMKAINFVAKSIAGENIVLDELRGNIVLLDFWGTWCAPCRDEIPKLKSIYEQYKTRTFKMIGIANDNLESLNEYVKENKVEWIQIIQENDKTIISDYNVVGYPTTFLIDEEGKILAKGLRAEELSAKIADIMQNK